MRGLAAAIMLQGHVFESWVRPQDRSSESFWLTQFLGGLPAPMFLLLVGVSLALALDRMRTRGASRCELAAKVLRRGGWILLLAYAFRIEQWLVWYPGSKLADVFRVDTLNCIAASTLAIGLFSILFTSRGANLLAMAVASVAVVVLTPFLYPLRGIHPFLLSYFNGGGEISYFSLIPWTAFSFVGITLGYALLEARARSLERRFFECIAIAGILFYTAGTMMSHFPVFEYGFFDYSLTSPHFFLVRLGMVLLILYGAYIWSLRRNAVKWSPLHTLGTASLPVYWIHIEIVYGRPFHHLYRGLDMFTAAGHLLWIIPAMVLLGAGWNRLQLRNQVTRDERASTMVPSVAGSDSGK
jgi:uncharacterized membrane protein